MNKIIVLILLWGFYLSCQPTVEIPNTGRKIVINALVATNEPFALNVTKSLHILDSSIWLANDTINGAKVYLFHNQDLIDTLTKDEVIFGYPYYNYFQLPANFRSLTHTPRTGNYYSILVSSDEYQDAYATTLIPNRVEISKMDTNMVVLSGTFDKCESNIAIMCDVQFKDPLSEKNYYLFYVYRTIDDSYRVPIEFECNDPIIEEALKNGSQKFGVAFGDNSINGKEHRLTLSLKGTNIGKPFLDCSTPPGNPPHKTSIQVCLYSITEEYFKYIQTLNLFLKNYKNPLAEPSHVYSNVSGGYGIFAGAAVSCDSLVFNY